MTELEAYDAVRSLLVSLMDRAAELNDVQHLHVMEAFNVFADEDHPSPLMLPVAEVLTIHGLLRQTTDALSGLVDVTSDGAKALRYARIHLLLVAALAA